ncbi:isochorismatase family cysteine hydrolase [Paenibacillus aurantius]|uniref:Isochorismatase family cysteine hydrolase n=1 Tax=Paenibacillus aurantius TaxID=2918900 RepID=A0AA96RI64_9BACL|nr:isochorismatase family cysteine hydrolase [Paenibacillus aurantius]WNQ14113.1 isochorismatase family cysteine hydrolase [Paenibacillus aurantius]
MRSALLVLDVQKDFLGEHALLPVAANQQEPLIANINQCIEKATQENLPVVYIGNEFEKTQFLSNWFRNHAALKGSPGTELDDRIYRVEGDYFPKNRGDAFTNPELLSFLKSKQISHLFIIGVFAEGCVTDTAKGALRRSFKVTVLSDAVAGANDSKRDKALQKLFACGVSVRKSMAEAQVK